MRKICIEKNTFDKYIFRKKRIEKLFKAFLHSIEFDFEENKDVIKQIASESHAIAKLKWSENDIEAIGDRSISFKLKLDNNKQELLE